MICCITGKPTERSVPLQIQRIAVESLFLRFHSKDDRKAIIHCVPDQEIHRLFVNMAGQRPDLFLRSLHIRFVCAGDGTDRNGFSPGRFIILFFGPDQDQANLTVHGIVRKGTGSFQDAVLADCRFPVPDRIILHGAAIHPVLCRLQHGFPIPCSAESRPVPHWTGRNRDDIMPAAEQSEHFISRRTRTMVLEKPDSGLTVCKAASAADPYLSAGFSFIRRTDQGNLPGLPDRGHPRRFADREDGWKSFRIRGVPDFPPAGILAENGIFAVSACNTDSIPEMAAQFGKALQALTAAGYEGI